MSLSIAVAASLALPTVAQVGARTDVFADARLLEPQALRQHAAGAPRLPVIVNLVAPAQVRAFREWHDVAQAERHRGEVATLAATSLRRLPESEFTLRHRLENQATFSGTITVRGLELLLEDDAVESIELDREVRVQTDQGITLMNGDVARGLFDGTGISIAIVDTGIDYAHVALGNAGFPNAKVLGGFDFGDMDADPLDQNGHGTSAAGVAAGDLIVNGDYVGGVAPGASLYALKIVAGGSDTAVVSGIASSWDWCVTHQNDDPTRPIRVINTSFGGGQYASNCDALRPAEAAAAANAVAAGITLFCSAGNEGYCSALAGPACISDVISVGAVYDASVGGATYCLDPASSASCVATPFGGCVSGWSCTDASSAADQVICYSNSASFLDLLAPSNYARAPGLGGGYTDFGGTSAASPYAAGAAAVLIHGARVAGISLAPQDVRARLRDTGDLRTDPKSGIATPRVNLGRAVDSLGTWVDFAHAGIENGTPAFPFNTLAEGIAAVPVGGNVIIRQGTTPATGTITKSLTLRTGGTVTIGQ